MPALLRPLDLGELLDRTFFLYRKHFGLFVGIMALPHLLVLAVQVASAIHTSALTTMGNPFGGIAASFLWMAVALIAALLAMAASQAATVVAVSNVHLDRPTSVSECYSAVKGRIIKILFIIIGIGFLTGIGFILLIVPGVILMLMWYLTVPVVVVENKGFGEAMSRSDYLTKGSRLRILLIIVLFAVLTYIISAIWSVPLMIAFFFSMKSSGGAPTMPAWYPIGQALGTFFTNCLVGPLLTIATSLIYYDQRVRKEAFDIELMMASLDGEQPQSTAVTTV